MGINWSAAPSASPPDLAVPLPLPLACGFSADSPFAPAARAAFSRAICFSKRARCMASMPNVRTILRSTS